MQKNEVAYELVIRLTRHEKKVPRGFNLVSNFTPGQQQIFNQAGQLAGPGSYTSRLAQGDPALFDEMEAPAMRQFSQLQGENASRFSGLGMGARKATRLSKFPKPSNK